MAPACLLLIPVPAGTVRGPARSIHAPQDPRARSCRTAYAISSARRQEQLRSRHLFFATAVF